MLGGLAAEPPFRLFFKYVLKLLPVSARVRSTWELSVRPSYFLGVYTAARLARGRGVERISVIEFGCAGGRGLLALEEAATAIGNELSIKIDIFGFDAGPGGLPSGCQDYRDHPDFWKSGDFEMDVDALRQRLDKNTQLVIGDVADTVPHFVSHIQESPVGFVAYDLDLYSSTVSALKLFSEPGKNMLLQVPVYFDDIEFIINHKFAGELLAIEEFNRSNEKVKIDRWHGVKNGRPFPERGYLDQMYVAHDLEAISNATLDRPNVSLAL